MSLLRSPPKSAILKSTKTPIKFQVNEIKSVKFSSNTIKSEIYTISVGSQPSVILTQWNLERKHVHILSAAACVVAVSTSWLFFSAIPTLRSFTKAAESLEMLLDATTNELPDTMAGIRLSAIEIGDLTTELGDISQDMTHGVRRSTQIIQMAEDRMRSFTMTTGAPTDSVKSHTASGDAIEVPEIAKAARNLREGILKGRSALGFILGFTQFSRWALKFLAARSKKKFIINKSS